MNEGAAISQGLPQSARLQRTWEFERVRNEGERAVCGCLIVNWLRLPEGASSRLGVVTSRRIGGAVVRSRARRLMRETFRLRRSEFSFPVDMALIARKSINGKRQQDVDRDFCRALRRSGLFETQ
jgi:ribonuclease P protein component